MTSDRAAAVAAKLIAIATVHQLTLATAESLTGGMVASTIVDVPGASVVFRGGVVSYQTALKHSLLGVDDGLLAEVGAVDPRVAKRMAEGVRRALDVDGEPADVGIATTGVAGPGAQDGHAPGEVFVAVATAELTRVEHFTFSGSRAQIRELAAAAALELTLEILQDVTS